MNQLSLRIKPKLRLEAIDFVLHKGVKDELQAVLEFACSPQFRFLLIQGDTGQGKTHASLWLADALHQAKKDPMLLEGKGLKAWIENDFQEQAVCPQTCFLIDDADRFFLDQMPGDSAAFVRFYEGVKRAGGVIVCFMRLVPEDFPCDEHILSRLYSAQTFVLSGPQDSDVPLLISVMSRQRGIDLGERKIQYVVTRVGRDIRAMVNFLDRLQSEIHDKGTKVSFPNLSEIL